MGTYACLFCGQPRTRDHVCEPGALKARIETEVERGDAMFRENDDLRQRLEEMELRLRAYADELKWYGDPEHYMGDLSPADHDRGMRARHVLAGKKTML
jgi:hypothetical protein